MPIIHIHYDGWLSLPAEARKHLNLVTGDRLEVEVKDGALTLRPVRQAEDAKVAEVAAPQPVATSVDAIDPVASKRGPGRPRKSPAPTLTPRIKVGGRRRALQTV